MWVIGRKMMGCQESKSRVCMDLTGVSLVGPGLGKHEQVVPQWRKQGWSLKT